MCGWLILASLIFFIAKKILDKTFEDEGEKREKNIATGKLANYGTGNLQKYGFRILDKKPVVKPIDTRRLKK